MWKKPFLFVMSLDFSPFQRFFAHFWQFFREWWLLKHFFFWKCIFWCLPFMKLPGWQKIQVTQGGLRPLKSEKNAKYLKKCENLLFFHKTFLFIKIFDNIQRIKIISLMSGNYILNLIKIIYQKLIKVIKVWNCEKAL